MEYKIILKEELESLIRDRIKLHCLEFAGVYDWDKYNEAIEEYKDLSCNIDVVTSQYPDYLNPPEIELITDIP